MVLILSQLPGYCGVMPDCVCDSLLNRTHGCAWLVDMRCLPASPTLELGIEALVSHENVVTPGSLVLHIL